MKSIEVLVLVYSVHGATRELADWIAEGISRVPNAAPRLRTVPKVAAITSEIAPAVPPAGAPYVQAADLEQCAGLALGSPTRFGNMAAPMKYFWDSTVAEWTRGTLSGKPACVFTSSSSLHGGQESTLLSMMLPLLHHGMLIVGLPFTEAALSSTQSGGSPYGATHWAGADGKRGITADERELALAQGKRLALAAQRLA